MDYIVFRAGIKGRQYTRVCEKEWLVRTDEVNAGLRAVIPYMSGFIDKLIHMVRYQELTEELAFPCFAVSFPEERGPCIEVS